MHVWVGSFYRGCSRIAVAVRFTSNCWRDVLHSGHVVQLSTFTQHHPSVLHGCLLLSPSLRNNRLPISHQKGQTPQKAQPLKLWYGFALRCAPLAVCRLRHRCTLNPKNLFVSHVFQVLVGLLQPLHGSLAPQFSGIYQNAWFEHLFMELRIVRGEEPRWISPSVGGAPLVQYQYIISFHLDSYGK